MRRTTLHIILLIVLGLYYNGAAAVWVAYSTVAKDFFIEHCENPTKPCCKGQCHVKQIEDRSGAASGESKTHIQITDPQPTIPVEFSLSEPCPRPEVMSSGFNQSLLFGLHQELFRPPRA